MSAQPPNAPTIAVAAAYPPIGRFIALALRVAGYAPHLLADGEEALAYLRAAPVAAAILDAHLGKIDGFALCQHIRPVSAIPIVLLFPRDEAHLQAQARQSGATTCLFLPATAEEVLTCVRKVLPQLAPARSTRPPSGGGDVDPSSPQ